MVLIEALAPSLNWPRVNDGSVTYENAGTTVLGQHLRQTSISDEVETRDRFKRAASSSIICVRNQKRGNCFLEDTTGFSRGDVKKGMGRYHLIRISSRRREIADVWWHRRHCLGRLPHLLLVKDRISALVIWNLVPDFTCGTRIGVLAGL